MLIPGVRALPLAQHGAAAAGKLQQPSQERQIRIL